jgi:hypothetical protein
MCEQDWNFLFSLLLTSTSLQELNIDFRLDACNDAFISALAHYLGGSFLKTSACSTATNRQKPSLFPVHVVAER